MNSIPHYDVVIIGGSFSGLSAAMSLGRALRKVLVVDSGHPCNEKATHAHNFIGRDGIAPGQLLEEAKADLTLYKNVEFQQGYVTDVEKTEVGFITHIGSTSYTSGKLILATGIKDMMPAMPGFADCWGISVLHCPFCHGYEIKNQTIGLIGNGETGYELSRLISNWSNDLILFTNGPSKILEDKKSLILKHNIRIIEDEIGSLQHKEGKIKSVRFVNGHEEKVNAIFARPEMRQHDEFAIKLGCKLTESNHIQVDEIHRTGVDGLYAVGDNSRLMRSIALAISDGSKAGGAITMELISEEFN